MFFIFSKTISFIVKPLGFLFLMILLQLYIKNHTKRKRLTVFILVYLYIFSCPVITNVFMSNLEVPNLDITKVNNYQIGVVLSGGFVNESKSTNQNLYLGNQADRIWQAAELYKLGKIKQILITGGDGFNKKDAEYIYENDKGKDFLIKCGVSPEDIIQEKESVNTYENALFSSKIIKNKTEKVLVITSGFHLKRALACFRKQNIICDGYPTSPISKNSKVKWIDFFPTLNSFHDMDFLVNEYIGILVYKIFGYI
ncbi:YdcF family protein [Lacihabitans sp. LS3-19]|nr:YdcF family protein [Lacihabitans sp. LS3-19]